MKYVLSSLTLFLLLTVFMGCTPQEGSDKRNIKEYYFPLDELSEGKVYEYHTVNNDSFPPFYWYYRTIEQEGTSYLTGQYYDAEFVPQQFFREEIISNGTLLNDYYLYETDTTGKQVQIPVEILSNTVFPFEVKDSSGIFLYKIKWAEYENPSNTMTLIRNRRFMGDDTYSYKGKKYDCVQFFLKELFDSQAEGHLEHQFQGKELYAKGIGLVYYIKKVSDILTLEYELRDIYDMKTFERKFKEQME